MKPLNYFLEPCVDIKYFLKQESMLKALEKGSIKIVNNNQYIANPEYNYKLADGTPRKAGVVREKEDNLIIPFTTNHQANIVNKTDTNKSKVNTITTNPATIKVAIPADEAIISIDTTIKNSTKNWNWNTAGVVKIPLTTFNAENYIRDNNHPIKTITASGANSRIKIAIPKDELTKTLNDNNLAAEMQLKDGENYVIFFRSKDGEVISGSYNRAWKNQIGTITTQNPIKILRSKEEIIELIKNNHKELNEYNKMIEAGNIIIQKYNEWAKMQDGVPLKEETPLLIPKADISEFEKLPVFIIDNKSYVVRVLTERECWRLMGFTDQDVEKVMKANISKSGLYHLAGNSIVVPVLESIFKEVLKLWVPKNNKFMEKYHE